LTVGAGVWMWREIKGERGGGGFGEARDSDQGFAANDAGAQAVPAEELGRA
jgi:hypothetical protein